MHIQILTAYRSSYGFGFITWVGIICDVLMSEISPHGNSHNMEKSIYQIWNFLTFMYAFLYNIMYRTFFLLNTFLGSDSLQ